MMPRGWMVASTLFALAGLPIGAGSGAAASPSVAALSLIASPPPALPPANPHFAISDLGTLGGETSSASSLNDLSQVVGSSLISAGAEHAFLYSAGKMSDLGTLGNASSAASGINNLGHVVGNSLAGRQAAPHAFLYSGGKMIDLGTLGGISSSASGINDADEVVGYSFLPVVSHSFVAGIVSLHAFLYSKGRMSDLGTLGGPTSVGTAINAIGQVVGNSFTAVNSAQHAFLYSGGRMSDLGTLGGANSVSIGINALGQAAGNSFISGDAAFHALLDSGGKMSDLGTLGGANSSANSVNALGQVVGESDTASGVEHAYFWKDGAMVDLNSLISDGSGWELKTASSISDGGEIVGSGTHNGPMHAFLLTPTDERALTPQEVSDAKGAIDRMISQLGIKANTARPTLLRFNYLITKLQVARLKLDQGSRTVAMNLLQSFVNVGSTLTEKEIAPDKKKLVLGAAQSVITQLAN